MPKMTPQMLEAFIKSDFPEVAHVGYKVSELTDRSITVTIETSESDLRPGGTVSGPTMMSLVDLTMYLLLLAQIGPVALAVTTNLNINFLRKPNPGKLRGEGRLLKLGKSLATGDVSLYSEGVSEPVAHATVTYAIPPAKNT
ncbi:PaaI family thioesterase [Sneathiella glossodoripedis]|uniref:PaaI family thioesterase n=1 Tax=Sneathiella glossodoripedis TaxID=418853 RepID=UPI0004725997|nr:PaaI family thioesterase [Sneathiella glossodoripedis]